MDGISLSPCLDDYGTTRALVGRMDGITIRKCLSCSPDCLLIAAVMYNNNNIYIIHYFKKVFAVENPQTLISKSAKNDKLRSRLIPVAKPTKQTAAVENIFITSPTSIGHTMLLIVVGNLEHVAHASRKSDLFKKIISDYRLFLN